MTWSRRGETIAREAETPKLAAFFILSIPEIPRHHRRFSTMGIVRKLDYWRANAVDNVSFGFVNLLQRRHPLPPDFLERWHAYTEHWDPRPVEEYYTIAEDYDWPEFPASGSGPWRFPSPIQSDFDANNTASFDLFPSAKGWSAPTMILAHGLMSVSDYGYRLWAKRLNERGWNALFMHLPYHYSRRLPQHATGEFAVNAHLIRVAEGIRQAVQEVRVALQVIQRTHGTTLFGGWGTSYGGWIMGMTAGVEPLLQRLILVEPILNVESAIWDSPAGLTIRRRLTQLGLTAERTRPHMRLCCPSKQTPKLEGRHILLLAGEYDRIAPPEEIRALNQAWPGSHYQCVTQGHVGYALMPASFRLAQELWPEDFDKPSEDLAPSAQPSH